MYLVMGILNAWRNIFCLTRCSSITIHCLNIAWRRLASIMHPIFVDFYHEWTLLSMMQCQTLICWAHLRCVAAWLQVGEHPQLPHRPVGHLILLGLWRDLAWKHDAKQKGLDFHVNLNPIPPDMSCESRIFIRKQSLLGDPNCTGEHRHLKRQPLFMFASI